MNIRSLFLPTLYDAMCFFVSIVFFAFFTEVVAQSTYPINYFKYPLDTPILASGPFGSLRDNHFHSGMDLRTQEREGLPVYAVADGYVSRIKYSAMGYGKAIYIQHPNGYTSVYGHLQKANGEIGGYIKRYQYEIKRFEFDHFPQADRLQVKQGDIIGWSGNSGTSSGPHLHFEIRNTKTEEIINPRLFGLHFKDDIKPAISKVVLFQNSAYGMKQSVVLPLDTQLCIISDSGWVLKQVVQLNFSTVGFGVLATDWLTDLRNQVSIYQAQIWVDEAPLFTFKLDRFAFADTKSVNTHIDYAHYKSTGERIQKLCLDDGNTARLYPYLKNKGWFGFADTLLHWAKIRITDFDGQQQIVYVPFRWSGFESLIAQPSSSIRVLPKKKTNMQLGEFAVQFSPTSLYDTLYCKIEKLPEIEKGMLSSVFSITPVDIPLQQSIAISIVPSIRIDSAYASKLIMLQRSGTAKWRSIGGEWDGKKVMANASSFGVYTVGIDTVPPSLSLLVSKNTLLTDSSVLRWMATDLESGICCYQLLVNGNWVLAEYDAKNDELRYDFDENTPAGKLVCELTVWDKRNNETKKVFTINK